MRRITLTRFENYRRVADLDFDVKRLRSRLDALDFHRAKYVAHEVRETCIAIKIGSDRAQSRAGYAVRKFAMMYSNLMTAF